MTPELEGGLVLLRVVAGARTALLAAILAAALCTLCGVFAPATARADGFELCAGYAPCNASGMTTHGYENAAFQSWWSMYAGINCTNYAAYVESQVYGVARPAVLLGDAYQWAASAAGVGIPVDTTPSVGAVAVWGADAPGMSGFGHVAVVESVGPGASYINVSQSGMGAVADGFDWQRIYRNGTSWEPWPTSFIHFSGPGIPGTLPRAGLRVSGAVLAMAGG